MKKILFLDDMETRRNEFLAAFKSGVATNDYEIVFAATANEAIQKLVSDSPFFAIYLDHDLTVEFFRPDVPTGMHVAKNLVSEAYLNLQHLFGLPKPYIFLHSWNEDGRGEMYEALKTNYKVFRNIEDLKNREIWKLDPVKLFEQAGIL